MLHSSRNGALSFLVTASTWLVLSMTRKINIMQVHESFCSIYQLIYIIINELLMLCCE